MKAIPFITLKSDAGIPIRDSAPEMVGLEFMELQSKGEPLPPEAYPILDTKYLILRMLDLATYKTRAEQRTADEIYRKVKAAEILEEKITLEDGEVVFLNKIRETFKPYLGGRIFNPFHEAMEQATTV